MPTKILSVAYGIRLFVIYLHRTYIYIVHTHIHTHPPSSQHTARTQTHSHAHTNIRASSTSSCMKAPDQTWSLRCCLCAPMCTPTTHSPSHGHSAGWASRAGVLFSFLLSLTCSTCPIFSSLHYGFDWVECQNLPGTEPRAATEKPISCGHEPPRTRLGACRLWKGYQGNGLHRWPPPVTTAVESHGMSQHMASSFHFSFLR